MKRQFFSGNTLEQAVMQAARHFGIDPERVAYDQREKKHGFLKVRRRVVIEVDSTAPEQKLEDSVEAAVPQKATPAQDTAFVQEPEPVSTFIVDDSDSDQDQQDLVEEEIRFESAPLSETASVERAVREILRFVKVRAEVTVERGSDVFVVEISNPDRDDLIDREGRILQAMEYLVPRLVRNWMGQGVPVKIDCEGFRVEREEKLAQLAKEVADQVRQDSRSQSLDPMSPADRRLIHLALADDPDVFTESDGDGYYKRVRILAEEDDSYIEDDVEEVNTAKGTAQEDTAGVYEDDEYEDDDEYDDDEYEDDDEYDDDEYEDDEHEDDEDDGDRAGNVSRETL